MKKLRKSREIGNIIGRFEILDSMHKNGDTYFKVKCTICGTETEKCRKSVIRKTAECHKCGLTRRPASVPHSYHGTKIHSSYESMIRRVKDKKDEHYPNYGGRGITVCDEWYLDFMKFYEWAMANGYEEGLTIDRIDNDGNYEPYNCRWATAKTQARNRSNNVSVKFRNEVITLSELAEKLNIPSAIVYSKYSAGQSVDDIVAYSENL